MALLKFKTLKANSADNKLVIFSYFSKRTGFDILCKFSLLSAENFTRLQSAKKELVIILKVGRLKPPLGFKQWFQPVKTALVSTPQIGQYWSIINSRMFFSYFSLKKHMKWVLVKIVHSVSAVWWP